VASLINIKIQQSQLPMKLMQTEVEQFKRTRKGKPQKEIRTVAFGYSGFDGIMVLTNSI
jgi:hypothetical protein